MKVSILTLSAIAALMITPAQAQSMDPQSLNKWVAQEKHLEPLPLPQFVYAPGALKNYMGDGVDRIAAYNNGYVLLSDRAKDYHVIHELAHYYQHKYKQAFKCPQNLETDAIYTQNNYCIEKKASGFKGSCPIHDDTYIMQRGCKN